MRRRLRRFIIGLVVTALVVGGSILFLDDDAAIAFGLFGTILSAVAASGRDGGSDAGNDGGSWSGMSDSGGGGGSDDGGGGDGD